LLEKRIFSREEVAILKFTFPIIIMTNGVLSANSSFLILFTIGCLKPILFVLDTVSFSLSLIPKPGENCLFFPLPF